MSDDLDIRVNRIINNLRNHWINIESKNYDTKEQSKAYKKFMDYHCGGNPYNVLEEKYQERIGDINEKKNNMFYL